LVVQRDWPSIHNAPNHQTVIRVPLTSGSGDYGGSESELDTESDEDSRVRGEWRAKQAARIRLVRRTQRTCPLPDPPRPAAWPGSAPGPDGLIRSPQPWGAYERLLFRYLFLVNTPTHQSRAPGREPSARAAARPSRCSPAPVCSGSRFSTSNQRDSASPPRNLPAPRSPPPRFLSGQPWDWPLPNSVLQWKL
jgi:hypothetical protein